MLVKGGYIGFPLSRQNMGVYGDLIIIDPKPISIYLRGTICWDY